MTAAFNIPLQTAAECTGAEFIYLCVRFVTDWSIGQTSSTVVNISSLTASALTPRIVTGSSILPIVVYKDLMHF